MAHHAKVSAKKTAPITTTSRLIGRRNAARTTRRRSSGECRSRNVLGRSELLIALHAALRVVLDEGQTHAAARLQCEGAGGVALVHREAQAPVAVRDEDEIADLRVAEGLNVVDQHLAALAGFHLQQRAEP